MHSDEGLERHLKLIIEMNPSPHVNRNIIATRIIPDRLQDDSDMRYKPKDPLTNHPIDEETGTRKRMSKKKSSGSCR